MVVLTRSAVKKLQKSKRIQRRVTPKGKKRSRKRATPSKVVRRPLQPQYKRDNLFSVLLMIDYFTDDDDYISTPTSSITSTPPILAATAPPPSAAPTPTPSAAPTIASVATAVVSSVFGLFTSPTRIPTLPPTVDGLPNEDATSVSVKKIKNCCEILSLNSKHINNMDNLKLIDKFYTDNGYIPKYEYSTDTELSNLKKVHDNEIAFLSQIDVQFQYEKLYTDIKSFILTIVASDPVEDIPTTIQRSLPSDIYNAINVIIIESYNTCEHNYIRAISRITKDLDKRYTALAPGSPDPVISSFVVPQKCIIESINKMLASKLSPFFNKLLEILKYEKTKESNYNYLFYRVYFNTLRNIYNAFTKKPKSYNELEIDEYAQKMTIALRVYNEIIIIEDYVDISSNNRFPNLTKDNATTVDLTMELEQLKQDIKNKMIDVGLDAQASTASPEIKHQARLTCLNYTIGKDLTDSIKTKLTVIEKVFPYKASMKRLLKNVLHIESFLSNNTHASGAMHIKTIYEKEMDMYRFITAPSKKIDLKPKFRFIFSQIKFSVFLPIYLEIKSFVEEFTDTFNSNYNMTKVVKEIHDKVSQINGAILVERLNITAISVETDKRSIAFIGNVGGALTTWTLPEEINNNNINLVISKLSTYTLKYNTFFDNPNKKQNIYNYFYNDVDYNKYLITLLNKIITYREVDPVLQPNPDVETTPSVETPARRQHTNYNSTIVGQTLNATQQSRQSRGRPLA